MKITTRPLSLLMLACLPVATQATQSFEEFKREQMQGSQQVVQEFTNYKNKMDADFAGFLKQQWQEFEAFKTAGAYKKPKPDKLPVAKPHPKQEVPPPPPVVLKPEPTPVLKPQPGKPVEPDEPPPFQVLPSTPTPIPVVTPPSIRPRPGEMMVEVDYFGNHLQFTYAAGLASTRLPHRLDADAMAGFWQAVATTEHEPLLNQLRFQQRALQLNDWAYVVLLHQLAQAIYPDHRNEQNALSWFLLLKSGYKARLGYNNEGEVYLLIPARQMIQFAAYLTYEGEKYFILDTTGAKQPSVSALFSYQGDYKAADKSIDMRLVHAIQTKEQPAQRKLSFSYGGKPYALNVDYDREAVSFLHTYPQVSYEVFFKSDVHRLMRERFLGQLRPMLQGMSDQDAANFLLRLTQTAFKYATDQEQFGYEDSLFPEETIYYPASDCEDRAYFFAWLIRELLGLEVVGLLYPNHMATAVRFKEKVSGENVRYQGATYLISDPTYINANIGSAMPQFKGVKPEVIPLR